MMKEITINCCGLESPRALHRALAEALDFPDWYGCNLDALHDCLTEISGDIHLTLLHLDSLGIFANSFYRVLQDAVDENPHLQVTII